MMGGICHGKQNACKRHQAIFCLRSLTSSPTLNKPLQKITALCARGLPTWEVFYLPGLFEISLLFFVPYYSFKAKKPLVDRQVHAWATSAAWP